MIKSPALQRISILLVLILGVFLTFRFILPFFLPFLLSYALMQYFLPKMDYLHNHLKFPKFLSHYGFILLFWGIVFFSLFFLSEKLLAQFGLFVENIPHYKSFLLPLCERYSNTVCHFIDHTFDFSNGTSLAFLEKQMDNCYDYFLTFVTGKSGKTILCILQSSCTLFINTFIVIMSTLLLIQDLPVINKYYKKLFFYPQIHSVFLCLKKGIFTYLRAEIIIFLINWIVCSAALFLIHNPYFFLLGLTISFIDVFPVLGSGFVFVPWSIFCFMNQEFSHAVILLVAYAITMADREYLEARLLGDGLGLNPFFMLAAIFIGMDIFGFSGILLGPLAVVLIRTIYNMFLIQNSLSEKHNSTQSDR